MPIDAFRATSKIARPRLPDELAPEPRKPRHRPTRAIDILTVSDNPTLNVYLSGLFQRSGWTIANTRTCAGCTAFIRDHRVAVAICEEILPDGSWCDAAAVLNSSPDAPEWIVVGAEVLAREVRALGGFDALVRPLRESDVVWTVASAWHAWMKRLETGGSGVLRCSDA